MRAVTVEEIERIAGGLKKLHPNALKTDTTVVHVTTTVTSSSGGFLPVGFGGTGSGQPPRHAPGVPGVGGGGGGAGYSPPPVSEKEAENLLETIAEEIEAGELGAGTIGDAVNLANLEHASGTVMQTIIEDGEFDYHWYEEGLGHTPAHTEYNKIMDWSDVDWSKYDDGGTATFMQELGNAMNAEHG